MFTGIIRGKFPIVDLIDKPGLRSFGVVLSVEVVEDVKKGASVAVDGVCLTVVEIDRETVWFDAMTETCRVTTIGLLKKGDEVNVERSAKMGDEIGGHVMSGHISTTCEIVDVSETENNKVMTFHLDPQWMPFIFSKGFVGLDGASLTIVNADRARGTFQVWFIPETLRLTRFGQKQKGDRVNVEFDAMTQAIVETVNLFLSSRNDYEKNCCGDGIVSQSSSGTNACGGACDCS